MRPARRSKNATIILASLLAVSCGRDGGETGRVKLSGLSGTFFLEDDLRTAALTATRHSVFYMANNERRLIFKGHGPGPLRLAHLGDGTVLLRYCGGTILSIESVFFENITGPSDTEPDARLLRLQPVTASGLMLNGQPVCS